MRISEKYLKSAYGFLLACACLPLSVLAIESPSLRPLDGIAAIVNEDIITVNELNTQVQTIKALIREQGTPPPPEDILRRQVLENEIRKQLQLQIARNTGIIVNDNMLDETINNIASSNNKTVREFRQLVEQQGLDFAAYREDIRSQQIIAILHNRDINSRVTVTDQEISNFIATQSAQGDIDDEFELGHILISVPEAASADNIAKAKQKAQDVIKQLKQGAEFNQLAIKISNDQQTLQNSNLDWRKAGQLPTLFASEVVHMKVGDISDSIRSPSGFHVIKLLNKRAGKKHIITQTKARHILLKPNELATKIDVIARLRQLKSRIEGGDSFEELAKSHSEDRGSAIRGGDLGWINPGDMVPQFEQAMDQLKANQISEPFQTQFGWHIAQVIERRQQDQSDEFSRNQARNTLRQRKIEEQLESWLRQRRDEAYVEYKLKL